MKHVYVISAGPKIQKIGVSSDPMGRLRELQISCPFRLRLISAFEVKDLPTAFRLEEQVHLELQEFNTSGEWFSVTPEEATTAVESAAAWILRPPSANEIERYTMVKLRRTGILFEYE